MCSQLAIIVLIYYSVFLTWAWANINDVHNFAVQFDIIIILYHYIWICVLLIFFLHERKIQKDRYLFHRCITEYAVAYFSNYF